MYAAGIDETGAWNGAGGQAWVELQEILDRLFQPLEQMLVDEVVSDPARARVLDVGCGTGATTVAMARRLGTAGDCTGIDISEPMLAAARSRAERDGVRARFMSADAQRYRFEPASYDMVVSRFGVMFFDDFIEAFANLRAATRPGGGLRFIAWRSAEDNPFMTTAERAAAPLVTIPPREPSAPGQFAFADGPRSLDTRAERLDGHRHPADRLACTMPEKELLGYLTRLGAVGRALADVDAPTRDRIADAVRPAFDPYVDGTDVDFVAACWLAGRRAGPAQFAAGPVGSGAPANTELPGGRDDDPLGLRRRNPQSTLPARRAR